MAGANIRTCFAALRKQEGKRRNVWKRARTGVFGVGSSYPYRSIIPLVRTDTSQTKRELC